MQSVLILLGAPGAGKGTQAMRLSEDLSLPHVATGDLFRMHLKNGTEFGTTAKGYMEAGKLVPDEVVLDMLFDRVEQPDCGDGYLLDGFPRTLPQAEALDGRLADVKTMVLNLEVADETIVGRAAGRLLCKSCTSIYHKENSPPSKEGVCDNCGGELYQRKDDAADVVRERLKVYHTQTRPLVDFYAAKGVLRNIDGERDPAEVRESLLKEIKGDA